MFKDLTAQIPSEHESVAWLGHLPAHWDTARGKSLFRREKREPLDGDGVVTCFRDGLVTLRANRRLTGFTEAIQESGYQGIREGDLVIHAMDAFAGAVGVSDSDGKSSPVYAACTPRGASNVHYYAAVVREMARTGWIAALARGVRERSTDFRFESFANQVLPVPPYDEQAAIVKYLGHARARIDRAIDAKRKLIVLLEEQKQAIIHQAVTRGLDPTVSFKDSGLPWLGDIPARWKMIPARYLFRPVNRRNRDGTEVKLSVTQARGLVPTDQMLERSMQASNFDSFQVCDVGDLVLNKYKAHLGVFWAATLRGLITPNYTVFAPAKGVKSSYYERLFHTPQYRAIFSSIVYGVTAGMSPLYNADFNALHCAQPPESEQREIILFAEKVEQDHARVASRVLYEIDLLREFRTRLTSDVVTGKFDVRAIAETLRIWPASPSASPRTSYSMTAGMSRRSNT